MNTTLHIIGAGVLVCIATACDWENSHSDRIRIKRIHNSCSTTDFVYEGDKIITVTESFGERVAETKNFFYVHDLLTSVEMTSDNGSSFKVTLEYDADRKLSREIHAAKYDGVDWNGTPLKTSSIKVSDFLYDDNGNIITMLVNQSNTDAPDYGRSNGGKSAEDELNEEKKVERYDYTWSKGNVIKETRRTCDEHGSCSISLPATLYTYDNKRNYTNQELPFRYINYLSVPFVFFPEQCQSDSKRHQW